MVTPLRRSVPRRNTNYYSGPFSSDDGTVYDDTEDDTIELIDDRGFPRVIEPSRRRRGRAVFGGVAGTPRLLDDRNNVLARRGVTGHREAPDRYYLQDGQYNDDLGVAHLLLNADNSHPAGSTVHEHHHHHHHHHYVRTPSCTSRGFASGYTPRQIVSQGHHSYDRHTRGVIAQLLDGNCATRPNIYLTDNAYGCRYCTPELYRAAIGHLERTDVRRCPHGHRIPLGHGRLLGASV